jgi:hypothetical protein
VSTTGIKFFLVWLLVSGHNVPRTATQHTCANFYAVYIFDMRKMNRALNVLKDHVAAVMDVEFSPTGEELVVCVPLNHLFPLLATVNGSALECLPQMDILGVRTGP